MICDKLQTIHTNIVQAAERSGRNAEDIQLVAVSKRQDIKKIRAISACGQQIFGENYLQEAQEKIAVLEDKKVSTLVYDTTIDYLLNKPSLPKKVHDDLREVQILIRNIANNVNQVAHHSNIIEGLIDEHD